ncbi:uncharacterized protein LOC122856384 [Aphidius gifuensis]|uniref:uncharacterized protein LOC122856384 n=1 Tax=Aphidius gifuensis TaxID=684658 RepID=UPI001CDD47C7|nr:uncharacterized protein LOC122856384 [Aphidius gifuensis]
MAENPALQQAYCDFMNEYESQGHMVEASPVEDHSRCYYLPHHSVIKESSTSTKLRVVFNGSQKTNTGESLNDNLYEGPKLLNSLVSVLTQWRAYQYVFSCDIRQMFRQIIIHPDDQKYQRILWRHTLDSPVQEYELTTVTYGTKPAPFLALATLKQLELEEGDRFPLVKSAISQGSYMDDIYVGADNIQQGVDKVVQIQQMLHSGGFELRKWISNSSELLSKISVEFHEKSSTSSDSNQVFRTLGLNWDTTADCFSYIPIVYKEPKAITKRVVLAQVAQLFDPLGWISPVIVKGKLFMQSLWKIKLDWDEPIPENLLGPWRDFVSQLSHLSEIKIPRWLNLTPTVSSIEIHGFGDASDAAIGAVVYLVSIDTLGVAKSNIIASKSKLAPIKAESNSSNKTRATWHHVPGEDNPADIVSRGTSSSQLHTDTLWWQGQPGLSKSRFMACVE